MKGKLKSYKFLILLLWSVLSFQGCIYLVIGSIGAVGGYVVSPDTVQGTVERDREEVWEASFNVANIMGNVIKQNDKLGTLEAIINNSRVNINMTQFTPDMVRLSVKARKSFFPNISTAQDVYVKIINQMGK